MCVQGRNIDNKRVAWENCYQEKARAHSEDHIAIGTERVLRRLDTWEEVAKSLLSLVPCWLKYLYPLIPAWWTSRVFVLVRFTIAMRPLVGMNWMFREKCFNLSSVIRILDASSHLVIFRRFQDANAVAVKLTVKRMCGESNAIVFSPFRFFSTAAFYFLTIIFSFFVFFFFCIILLFFDNNIFLILFRSLRPSWKLSSGPTQPLRMRWLLGFQTLRGVKYQWRMSSAKMTTNSRKSKWWNMWTKTLRLIRS